MMSQHKRVFIIGHCGAGKSVLAQVVAKKLGWQFIDADFSLVASIGRTLSEVVGLDGEAHFQQCLANILSHQIDQENIVVTTDEHIICSETCRTLLAAEFTVYVTVSTTVQLERISHNRPLLPVTDYSAFLDTLHEQRDMLYEQVASLSVNSDKNTLEEHVANIVRIIKDQ